MVKLFFALLILFVVLIIIAAIWSMFIPKPQPIQQQSVRTSFDKFRDCINIMKERYNLNTLTKCAEYFKLSEHELNAFENIHNKWENEYEKDFVTGKEYDYQSVMKKCYEYIDIDIIETNC